MISESVYQAIYDEIRQYLATDWEKLIVYFEYGEASYLISFYAKYGSEYVKCYDLPNVLEDDLVNSFVKINDIVSAERNKEESQIWSNMTMVLDSTGNVHIDYDYTDLSNGTFQFKKEWKKKYLV